MIYCLILVMERRHRWRTLLKIAPSSPPPPKKNMEADL